MPIVLGPPARGEADDIADALAQARLQYEAIVQAIREDVLDRIDAKQAALRAKAKPKLEEIMQLDTARSAFKQSGQWPAFRNFKDCQTRLRNAAKDLDEAFAKAEVDYLKSGHDALAKALRAEHEQFLKECDIGSWGDNVIASWKGEQRTIGSAQQKIDVGELATKPYRMEIIAGSMDGAASLELDVPVPGKKRVKVEIVPAAGRDLQVLLSIRESVISADMGVARPGLGTYKDDEEPRKLMLCASQGKIELKSVRFKPILGAALGDIVFGMENNTKQAPPTAPNDSNPKVLLAKHSKWRGYRWHGQNPNDLGPSLIAEATVTRNENGRIELQTNGSGNCGNQLWVFVQLGRDLMLAEIHAMGGDRFTEVQGKGSADGETLQFQSSARAAGYSINAIVYDKFELRKVPGP